jgi:predicted permease
VEPENVYGNYFHVLGVGAAVGRVFGDADNVTPHAHPIAVLSYDFWMNRFGGDPRVLGQHIVLGDDPLTIVGVVARGFHGVEVDHRPDIWVPAMMRPGQIMEPGSFWATIVARRRPGISRGQVQAAAEVMLRQYLTGIYGQHPNVAFRRTAMAQRVEVREAGVGLSELREEFRTPLQVLMAAVALVLLAACANVANLLLARGAARRREMAVRVSLGAARSRLIVQGLVESLLLAAGGAVCGVALAWWATQGILQFVPGKAAESLAATPDATVLAFTAAIAVAAALLFGLAPAVRTTAVDPAAQLQAGARQSAGHAGLRRTLVVVQVAFSVVLVVLAGLFGHSMVELRAFDPGFRSSNLVNVALDFPRSWTPAQTAAARTQFLGQIEAMPGVSLVSYAFPGPFHGGYSSGTVRVPGSPLTVEAAAWVDRQNVAPRFFEALGATIVAGREFARTDTTGARQVAVVNEAFVRKFLPGEAHVLEHVLEMGEQPTYIVGVVRDIAHGGLRTKVEPRVYVPIAQLPTGWEPSILIRTQMAPESLIPAVRREAARLGPQVGITEPVTLRQAVDESIFQDRLLAMLGGVFGLLALALAAVGLYGVVAYGTARRAREIGIRIALGARRGSVLWMVLRDAMLLAAAGLAVGLPAAYAAASQVAALLFGIRPADVVSFASTAAVLLAVGTAAAFLPARRAAGLEPLDVLRQD